MLGKPNGHLEIPIRKVGHAVRSCFPKTAAGEARFKMEVLSVKIDHLRQVRDYADDHIQELLSQMELLGEIVDADV